MKFLLDVHIATSIARAIEAAGYEVLRAALIYPTWSDADLLALAHRDKLIIVSEDSDFSDLVYAFGEPAPPAIIYVRCEPQHQRELANHILATIASGRLDNHMAVIRPGSTRYRPLPGKKSSNG